jgi:sRNA-binding regulator protein Hfq
MSVATRGSGAVACAVKRRTIKELKVMRNINLDEFMKNRLGRPGSIYLQNGIRLGGRLLGYDNDALFLRAAGEVAGTQMILWSAISTVVSDGKDPE